MQPNAYYRINGEYTFTMDVAGRYRLISSEPFGW